MSGPRSAGDGLVGLAELIQAHFVERRLTLATAESCTGGLISHTLTDVPGSSAYYLGGVVSYSDAVKVASVGVSEATLAAHGAVSEAVATEMAEGVLLRLRADVAVAVTGVAGPGGGTAEKPVGLTWVAVAQAQGPTIARRHVWRGDRRSNKNESARAAVLLLLEATSARPT